MGSRHLPAALHAHDISRSARGPAKIWHPCVPDFWHSCYERVDVGATGSFTVRPFRIQVGTRIAGIWIGFTLPP